MTAPLPRSIGLAGADGAGKSTQAERLRLRLERAGHTVTICTIWDLLGAGAAGGIPFRSKAEIDAFLRGLHGDARAMFLHMAMREALDRAREHQGDGVLLVVGYWLKYNASERAYGADPALLDALGAAFPSLSLGLWIDLPPEAALARKGEVSGYESAGRGRDGFLAFQRKVAPELARLRALPGTPWQAIDGGADVDAVEAAIAALVDPWLAREAPPAPC